MLGFEIPMTSVEKEEVGRIFHESSTLLVIEHAVQKLIASQNIAEYNSDEYLKEKENIINTIKICINNNDSRCLVFFNKIQ